MEVVREVTMDDAYQTIKMADKNFKMPESDKKEIKDRVKEKTKNSKSIKVKEVKDVQKAKSGDNSPKKIEKLD